MNPRGGFREGVWRGPFFVLFWGIHFWLTGPEMFLKAPKYTNFEGGARAEKKQAFLVKIFRKKCLKTHFLAFVFKILPAAHKIWTKQGLFRALAELGKPI